MESNTIVNIKTSNLYPHPQNPRKDLGNLDELADSIRKNGIMQNLTVIPLSALTDEPDMQPEPDDISLHSDFYVLIGHRRLSAAKLAGVTELPCKIISKISVKEQVGIMLEENMQRNDLTVYEQAQGFQMMLDLGETEDSIAEKTGFSKATIRHRLNIAKLDQNVLKSKEQQEGFQMNLMDLYELEKIEDIKERNKILNEATDSKNLAFRVRNSVKEAQKKVTEKAILQLLFDNGYKPAPASYTKEMYSTKWKTLHEYRYEDGIPEEIKSCSKEEPLYFYSVWYGVKILKKQKEDTVVKSQAQLKQEAIKHNKALIKDVIKRIDAARKAFIHDIIDGKVAEPGSKELPELKDAIWRVFSQTGASVYPSTMRKFFTCGEEYQLSKEERSAAQEKVDSLSVIHQMLIVLDHAIDKEEPFDYTGKYREQYGEKAALVYGIFEKYGWSFDDEVEKQIIDGTSELYVIDRLGQENEPAETEVPAALAA